MSTAERLARFRTGLHRLRESVVRATVEVHDSRPSEASKNLAFAEHYFAECCDAIDEVTMAPCFCNDRTSASPLHSFEWVETPSGSFVPLWPSQWADAMRDDLVHLHTRLEEARRDLAEVIGTIALLEGLEDRLQGLTITTTT